MRCVFHSKALAAVVVGLVLNPCLAQNTSPAPTHIPGPISVPDMARPGHYEPPTGNLSRLFLQFADRCWTRPASKTAVTLSIHFNIYGRVLETPRPVGPSNDPKLREAIAAATKAVTTCAPYKMPESRFREWEHLTVTFDPR